MCLGVQKNSENQDIFPGRMKRANEPADNALHHTHVLKMQRILIKIVKHNLHTHYHVYRL